MIDDNISLMNSDIIEQLISDFYLATEERPETGYGLDSETTGSERLSRKRASKLLAEAEYFVDVLASGYEKAVGRESASGSTLRTRRLDLGIDTPELDMTSMWSSKSLDGTRLSIPFVDYLAFQAAERLRRVLDVCCRNDGRFGSSDDYGNFKMALEVMLRSLLAEVPDGKVSRDYPVLGDRFLPLSVLRPWCVRDGKVREILGQCKVIAGVEVAS